MHSQTSPKSFAFGFEKERILFSFLRGVTSGFVAAVCVAKATVKRRVDYTRKCMYMPNRWLYDDSVFVKKLLSLLFNDGMLFYYKCWISS